MAMSSAAGGGPLPDAILPRVLTSAQLVGFIAVTYLLVVVAGGRWLDSAPRDQPSVMLTLGATAVVALMFDRVRRGAEFVSNRVVFGARTTPLEAVASFSEHVSSATEDELTLHMAEVVVRATGALRSCVWLSRSDGMYPAATFNAPENGTPIREDLRVLVEDDDVLGAFAIEKHPGDEVLAADVTVLRDLAALAATSFRNLQLQAELRVRVSQLDALSAELEESRHRIVQSQAAERRRLERDIHDGAQQYLTAVGLKLSHAALLLRRRPSALDESMREVVSLTHDAISAMTDLSAVLYPPELKSSGVIAALRASASRFPFTVEATSVGAMNTRAGEDIEAAVYFTCMEAMQNAAKHANASRVEVTFDEDPSSHNLVFAVADNGVGFDTAQAEPVGLQGLGDRLAALGGTVEVLSSVGVGTRVIGRVPLR